jgi:hypothetical protein
MCCGFVQGLYPSLMPDVKVRVIELTDHILHSDRKIGEFVAKQFKRSGEYCSTI